MHFTPGLTTHGDLWAYGLATAEYSAIPVLKSVSVQVRGVFLEEFQWYDLQRALMSARQEDARSHVVPVGLQPAPGTQAPAIPLL